VLIFNTKHLTIIIVRRLKLAVFTWRGFTPTQVYKEGTIQSLETLRDYPSINRIILNAKDHKGVLHDGIESSVKSTVDYLGIAQGNYRVAVIVPIDVLAKSSYRLYVELLNHALKKQFVVKQFENMKEALVWLIKPKFFSFFGKEK
jgi:hypothetical protein